jgi:hypothetical protein
MILSVANSRPRNMQSIQVQDLLPEHISNDANIDSLTRFLEDYYDYMNAEGQPSREIASLTQNKDIDAATEKYLDEIELLIAKYTPRSNLIDRERLLKIINHYYTVRGTEEGTKLFFKLFYGEDISINYPRERILAASDGSGKYENFSLITITLEDGTTINVKKFLNIVDNPDLRVYGQYEYNPDLRLYENIGKVVENEYSRPQLGDSIRGSELNSYVGHVVAMSADGSTIAVGDRKSRVKVYRYNSADSLWIQFGATLTGQSESVNSITLVDSSDIITLSSHGLNNGDEVSFTNIVSTIGLQEGRVYYVANKTADNFKITDTPGGKALPFSGNGSANLVVYKRFGHALALNEDGTQLLISEPGYSSGSYSGRVLLYRYDTKTSAWVLAKMGDSPEKSSTDVVYYGLNSLGDNVAVFGHAVAFNEVGDSIAISSTGHTAGTHLDYVSTLKYKTDPPIYKTVTINDTTDVITLASHGFKTGDAISFVSITDAIGAQIDKKYYVINTTPGTFKIAERLYSGQMETATAQGTITVSGNARVVLTSNAIVGGTTTLNVPVAAMVEKSGSISGTATTTTITGISSTAGLIAGGKLIKTGGEAGLGENPVITAVAANEITFTTTTPNSPGTITFNQLADTPNDWAQRVRNALDQNTEISSKFEVVVDLNKITLIRHPVSRGIYAAVDTTLNISITNNTCAGIVNAPISSDVYDGIPVNFTAAGSAVIQTYYSSWQSHGIFPLDESTLRQVTFRQSDDKIILANHGLVNGNSVVFNIVRDTDGIVAKREYFVVNTSPTNFQVALTAGGAAIQFTRNGTGTLLPQSSGIGKNINILNGENFGWALSYNRNGSRLAIGIPGAGSGKIGKCGKINVYDYNTSSEKWILLENKSLYGTTSPGEKYGTSVSLSGDGNTLIGGAPYRAGTRTSSQINVGAVISYSWKGQYWKKYGKVPLYGKYVEGLYGFKVSCNSDGSRLAVSTPGREIKFGDANINTYSYVQLYEFDRPTDMWIEQWQSLENKTYDLYLGHALAMDTTGQRLVCGTPYNFDPKKARRNGTTFTGAAPENNKPAYVNGSQNIAYTGTRWKYTNSQPRNVIFTNTTDIITLNSHGFENGNEVVFSTVVNGINVNQVYYVVDKTADNFKISISVGGNALVFNADGNGVLSRSAQSANLGDEDFPWLATWPALTTTPILAFERAGSVDVYSVEKVNNSFASDRTTRISKFSEEINGVKQENWAIYDIFSEAIIDNYRYSYITEPSGGINFNYEYSTLDYLNIENSSGYTASTTEPFVTVYYKAALKPVNGIYRLGTDNNIEIICQGHNYKPGSQVNINFTSGDLVDSIFTVDFVYRTNTENDTFIVKNTSQNIKNVTFEAASSIVAFTDHDLPTGTKVSFSTINVTTGITQNVDYYTIRIDENSFQLSSTQFGQPIDLVNNGSGVMNFKRIFGNGTVSLDAAPPAHPYEVHSWIPVTTESFDYVNPIVVYAIPDDIRWIKANNKGTLSDYYKIQDGDYYQIHSYEIKTQLPPQGWIDEFKGFCHPSGYELFSLLEVINFSKNNWVDFIEYKYGNRDHIPPRIRDLISKKEKNIKLPTDLYEMLSTFGGQHTPRSQYGRGMDRDLIILIFVKMLDDFGKTYTQRRDNGAIMFIRNMVRRLNTYLSFHLSTKYERGTNWEDVKFMGDDLDGQDDVLYNNVGKVVVYSYNSSTKKWSQLGDSPLGQRGDIRQRGLDNTPVNNDKGIFSLEQVLLNEGDSFGYSVSFNSLGTRFAVGAPWNDNDADSNFSDDNDTDNDYRNDGANLSGLLKNIGATYIYDYTYDNVSQSVKWMPVGNPIIGEAAGDLSGWNIMLNDSGSRVVIGAPNSGSNDAGHVRVYEYISGVWTQLGADIDGVAANDRTGTCVSINSSGSRIAVGTPYNNGEVGSVKIYEYISGSWTTIGTIAGPTANDRFGWSLSLNDAGDKIVIGAPQAGSNSSGRAYVYTYTGSTWTAHGGEIVPDVLFIADSGAATENFGWDISINGTGTRVAVASPQTDFLSRNNRGYIMVYELVSGVWTLLGQTIEGELTNSNGGLSISFNTSGSRLVVGSPNAGGGHTKVYEYDPITYRWGQIGNDLCGDAFPYKNGWSVDINSTGDRIVVGESGSNSRTEISDGQSLGNGLLDLNPESYMLLSKAPNSSKILNIPTHITRYKTTKRIALSI